MKLRVRVVVGLAALMVVACGSSTPDRNVRYESVFDMREVVESGGLECTGWRTRSSNEFALESADCTESIVFATFETSADIADQREFRHALLSIAYDEAFEVTGPNWNVGCSDMAECERLQALLGGEVLQTDLTDN